MTNTSVITTATITNPIVTNAPFVPIIEFYTAD